MKKGSDQSMRTRWFETIGAPDLIKRRWLCRLPCKHKAHYSFHTLRRAFNHGRKIQCKVCGLGLIDMKGKRIAGVVVISRSGAHETTSSARWNCQHFPCWHRATFLGNHLRNIEKQGKILRCKTCYRAAVKPKRITLKMTPSRNQRRVLHALCAAYPDRLTLKELGEASGVPFASVGSMLREAMRKGYVICAKGCWRSYRPTKKGFKDYEEHKK